MIAVALNLASDALVGGAKLAWKALRKDLSSQAQDGPKVEAWLDLLEADPSEELARQIAARLHELGVPTQLDLPPDNLFVRTQIASGSGSMNAQIGSVVGSHIGGLHIYIGRQQTFEVRATGNQAFVVTNTSPRPLSLTQIDPTSSIGRLEIRASLPRLLAPGEAVRFLAQAALGGGGPAVLVSYVQDGAAQQQMLLLG